VRSTTISSATGKTGGVTLVGASVMFPAADATIAQVSIDRSLASQAPIADEALQIGNAYPNHEYWTYQAVALDPSCGSLTWTYRNTIPGVTVTLNPTKTSLTGSTTVSFSTIPDTTKPSVFNQTVGAKCTNPNAHGVLPGPTSLTVAAVKLDIALVPQDNHAGTIESGKTFNPVAGQFIEVDASPAPTVTLRQATWTIPGDTVKTYVQTKAKASFATLGKSDLAQQKLEFYWIHGSAGKALALSVRGVFPVLFSHCLPGACNGTEAYWGLANAKSSADILAPTVVSITSNTGSVATDAKAGQLACMIGQHFGYVNMPGCTLPGAVPGIHWKMTAKAPPGAAGELDGTQLINRSDSVTAIKGVSPVPTPYPGTGGTKELDTCIHYGNDANMHVPIASGATGTYASDDSPGFPLQAAWKTFTAADTFVNYFVFKPTDLAGTPASRLNIWVPLGYLNWNWSGNSTNAATAVTPADQFMEYPSPARAPSWLVRTVAPPKPPPASRWGLTSSAHATNPTGVGTPTAPLPTWNALYSPAVEPCPPGG
jgi:hypothetical protein